MCSTNRAALKRSNARAKRELDQSLAGNRGTFNETSANNPVTIARTGIPPRELSERTPQAKSPIRRAAPPSARLINRVESAGDQSWVITG
jgi:hypothetical protein